MKTKYAMLILLMTTVLTACEYDNYKGPECKFTGQVTYEGKPFVMDPNVNVLRVYQKGFGKKDNGVSIKTSENGTFSQLLFSGDYYLTLANYRYPFLFKDFKSLGKGLGYDTIPFNLSSDKQMCFEVVPYYLIDSCTWEPLDSTSTTLNVTVYFRRNPDKALPDTLPMVQRAFTFVGPNQHINSATTCTKASRPMKITDSGNVTMRFELYKYRSATYYVNNYRDYLYFRVGLTLDAAEVDAGYYLFSDLYKVENVPYVTEN